MPSAPRVGSPEQGEQSPVPPRHSQGGRWTPTARLRRRQGGTQPAGRSEPRRARKAAAQPAWERPHALVLGLHGWPFPARLGTASRADRGRARARTGGATGTAPEGAARDREPGARCPKSCRRAGGALARGPAQSSPEAALLRGGGPPGLFVPLPKARPMFPISLLCAGPALEKKSGNSGAGWPHPPTAAGEQSTGGSGWDAKVRLGPVGQACPPPSEVRGDQPGLPAPIRVRGDQPALSPLPQLLLLCHQDP